MGGGGLEGGDVPFATPFPRWGFLAGCACLRFLQAFLGGEPAGKELIIFFDLVLFPFLWKRLWSISLPGRLEPGQFQPLGAARPLSPSSGQDRPKRTT